MTIKTDLGELKFRGYPHCCPYCHKQITPEFIYGHKVEKGVLIAFLVCPTEGCRKGIIAYYEYENTYPAGYWQFNGQFSQGLVKEKEYSEIIKKISNSFIKIYNQAYAADQLQLNEISGIGYRKALEFLIKDYATAKRAEEKSKIVAKTLAACIREYIDNPKIQMVASKAVWLGNDETHYIRKWENRTIEDLKILIELTVHWIEMEDLTQQYEEMKNINC